MTQTRRRTEQRAQARRPGADARQPTDIPAAGWKQILLRVKEEIKNDRVGLMAAGVGFYAMLAIFPALIAAITLWGLISDPAQIEQTIQGFSAALPQSVVDLLVSQIGQVASQGSSTLSWALALSLGGALWSASSGTKGLMNAVGAAYDTDETRGFLKVRGLALLFTIGGVFFALITIGLIAVIPASLGNLGLGNVAESTIRWTRWPILAGVMIAGLAIIYRYAPDREHPGWRWTAWGSAAATVLWLVASAGFAWYVSSLGRFSETYGSIAGVIVLMLWLFLTAFAILLGAELNAETEDQTRKDTTDA